VLLLFSEWWVSSWIAWHNWELSIYKWLKFSSGRRLERNRLHRHRNTMMSNLCEHRSRWYPIISERHRRDPFSFALSLQLLPPCHAAHCHGQVQAQAEWRAVILMLSDWVTHRSYVICKKKSFSSKIVSNSIDFHPDSLVHCRILVYWSLRYRTWTTAAGR